MEAAKRSVEKFESLASSMTYTATERSQAPAETAGDPLEVEDTGFGDPTRLEGVAAKLHMQDLMNHHAQKALERQSKLVKQGISRFREILREITGMVIFDLMIGVLVMVDTVCIILQQEWYGEADETLDSTEMLLRAISVAITTTFAVEFTARCVAQVGLGWSWLLALDGFIVGASFVEVVVYTADPSNAGALRLLRPLRGLRLLRAVRGCVRVARRSADADLALSAFEKSLRPLALLGTLFLACVFCASVILVLQLPGIMEALESSDLQNEVLEKFGSVLAATVTVLEVVFGSYDLGDLIYRLFEKAGNGRFELTVFLASILFFLVISSLCISGVVCGVLLSQYIVQKGDAEVDGGNESFRKNQELVLNLSKVFEAAGFTSSDNIDWRDILSVCAVDKGGEELEQSTWEYLLSAEEEKTEEKEQEDDLKRYKCILEHQGVTMEELSEAYHEMALFGPVSVEDYILCTFKHVANIKTVSMLSFNHQQNKVFWRIQYHAQMVDEALHEMRFKIGKLHSALPSMITEVEAASVELKELDALEVKLELKKKALRDLIEEKQQECGFAEVPKEALIQVERDEHELNEMLKELEKDIASLTGSAKLPLQPEDATASINNLADEMVQYLWGVIMEEMDESMSRTHARQTHAL